MVAESAVRVQRKCHHLSCGRMKNQALKITKDPKVERFKLLLNCLEMCFFLHISHRKKKHRRKGKHPGQRPTFCSSGQKT